jgi:arginine/ornithine N-succinyltransferase beta subunit
MMSGELKTVRFHRLPGGRYCSETDGEVSGEYVKADDVRELVKQLESAAKWIDTDQHDSRFGRDVLAEIRAVLAKTAKGTTP